ncbi:MAG: ATP-binding cassette domain-containing protein [Proteobacteria bacterium]|nr:ATP-binding cassette domain-containing protein [Pseudomonadota bacterium]NIS69827.1 ATP-binding cassette domain-containing protein [Pseudomonadota bacterium]
MLEVKSLQKNFGGLKAIDNCSLEVGKEAISGLIGPNGAGKTTLFNVLTGFHKPDGGEILFKGERITGLPPHKVFRKKICRTFQITREFGQMTVLENLMLVPDDQGGERIWNNWFRPGIVKKQERRIRDKALDVLEFVELIELKDEYAGNLSGGQKKLLELAKTMMADPELILLDEPGAGVNRTLMRKLADNIRELCAEKGITFLIIEHDMDLVMNLCNPVIVMSEGKKLAEGTPDEIRSNEEVLEAYLGGQYR